jgi:hypothetical protein
MTKITNKEQWNKAYEKKRLAGFWKFKWIPGRSIETWVLHLNNSNMFSRSRKVIIDAIKKLYLQNKISLNESQRLQTMLKSPDRDNVYMVVTVIHNLKPRMFERRVKQ